LIVRADEMPASRDRSDIIIRLNFLARKYVACAVENINAIRLHRPCLNAAKLLIYHALECLYR
jgi:hypothetical protein